MPFLGSKTRPTVHIRLSQVMSALSYALDLVEGQPQGHAVRSCIIGMRLAEEMNLPAVQRSELFYALLMKDLGCSSNATKMCYLFAADDRETKRDIKTIDWTNFKESALFTLKHVAPSRGIVGRMARMICVAITGPRASRELIQIRCERGASIARLFGLPEATAQAIHNLDEHWDGAGHPDGVAGEDIPLLARIMGIAQTAEVFHSEHGLTAMLDMVRERSGKWFDPELSRILLSIDEHDDLWNRLGNDAAKHLLAYEPQDQLLFADDDRLDRLAEGFGQVIDAKSPWTFRHSQGVAEIAVGIGSVLGMPAVELRDLRRAGLLHDVGKLGVSNLILDKPGKLTPEELAEVRRHPAYTQQILERVAGFSELAEIAASHHERLDGKGYHRGIASHQLGMMTRILCVADMYEALAAHRPYRQDLSDEEVRTILQKNATTGLCPEILEALDAFLSKSGFQPYRVAA